jgi:hypothetical protein
MRGLGAGITRARLSIAAASISLATGSPVSAADLTAGLIVKEMPPNEFVAYVTGMVEGMAYARFRKDTMAAGEKVQTGSDCIRNWYHRDTNTITTISDTFRKYPDYTPWVVLGVMLKQECGE